MFERFTDRARRAVVAAQDEARLLGHNHIGSEHLLLGLLDVQGGMAVHVLETAGVTAEAARVQVVELAGSGDKSPGVHIPFTPQAKKILELSLREALEQKKGYIGTEHILLGLMRDGDGIGAQVLQRLGWSLSALRQRVIEATQAAASDDEHREEEGSPESAAWDWQRAQSYPKGTRLSPPTVVSFRKAIAPIDKRLAAIERRLGIPAEQETAGGFRALLTSVDRHLTNIERHLGISADAGEAPGQPDEPPVAAD